MSAAIRPPASRSLVLGRRLPGGLSKHASQQVSGVLQLQALAMLKSYVGTKGVSEVAWLLTGNDSQGIDEYLTSAIESALVSEKNVAKAVAHPFLPPQPEQPPARP